MGSHYLQLLKNPLSFPPVSKEVNVFFDECNKQVFAVASHSNRTKVNVKGPENKPDANFDLPEKGNVISIKFSPDQRVLAIQRSSKTIDFVNFYDGANCAEYSQSCKGRSTQIKGFCWTGVNDIVFVTNQGIEFYQTTPDQSSLKLLKTYHATVNWFVYLPESSVLLLSSGIMGNVIHPYIFKQSSILRLPKFEVENPPSTRNPQPASLLERDVTVANIYNNTFVVILRNQPRCFNSIGAEIVLYQLQKDAPAKKYAVLKLGSVGRFAVNVVDNLVAVHHQASKTSMIFDINLPGNYDGQVTHYHPVLSPLPIEPFSIQSNDSDTGDSDSSPEPKTILCESYSPNWVVFQPNIIIDAKLACLWKLNVKLPSLIDMIEDRGKLVDFLLLRSESKSVILLVCNQILAPETQSTIGTVALIFDKLNAVYAEYVELNNTGTTAVNEISKENELTGHWFQKESVINQDDMYKHVFCPFIDLEGVSHKFVVAVLLEYVRSLNHHKIVVEYYLNEFIINLLVKRSLYYQLHQFIQYYVLSDSKPLACKLLTLENAYPPAYDLALDMMKRLDAHEVIIETLLEKNEIIAALKYLQNCNRTDSAVARKFISAAVQTGDDFLFYTVFTFFQERNFEQRKHTRFVRGEQCDDFEKIFELKYGQLDMLKKTDSLIENMGLNHI